MRIAQVLIRSHQSLSSCDDGATTAAGGFCAAVTWPPWMPGYFLPRSGATTFEKTT